MLKLVPFQDVWITNNKLDLKAIYRRPRYVEDAYGEMKREIGPDGLPAWDLTGGLPVRYHNKHRAKGFEYVTLADRESLHAAAAAGTVEDWRQYVQDPRTNGPWHYRKYVEGQVVADSEAAQRLAEMVAKYGPELVQEMKRETEPDYVLPEKFWAKTDEPAEPAEPVARRKPGPRPKPVEAA